MTNEKLTRKELEDAINNSEFFTLNKEDNPDVYETEHRKLMVNIYTYAYNVFPITRNNEFNLEIMETIDSTLSGYKKELGVFINYFNSSLKKSIQKRNREMNFENFHVGLSVGENDIATVAKIARYAISEGIDLTDKILIAKIIKTLGLNITPEYFLELNAAVVSGDGTIEDENGNSVSLIDRTADKTPDPGKQIVTEANRRKFLIAFEKVYKESREASKERNRLILSYILFFENDETGEEITDRKPPRFFMRYSFIDERVLNAFYSGEKLTQKDIAQMAGVSAVAITKAKNLLLEELKIKLKQGAVFNS